METGFLFRISAFAAESITFCITAAMCIVTGYIDGSCGAFAVLIVGAVVCFAVDVNGLTPTAGICGIFLQHTLPGHGSFHRRCRPHNEHLHLRH